MRLLGAGEVGFVQGEGKEKLLVVGVRLITTTVMKSAIERQALWLLRALSLLTYYF